jgi:hypothetical protein
MKHKHNLQHNLQSWQEEDEGGEQKQKKEKNTKKNANKNNIPTSNTLWLCQNSYWTWPIDL